VVLALLATAINYGNNLVFALAFVLLSVWLTAAWECRRNLRGLEWLPAASPAAFAGEVLCVAGQVRDPAARRRTPVSLCAGKNQGAAAGLQGHEGAALALSVPAVGRGRQRVEGLYLLSLHPLGLWRARQPLPAVTALVYPSPAGSRPLPERAPNPAHRRPQAGDFQDLRAYAPGDAPRRINWRVYGRSGELAVNNFDGATGGHARWLDIAACAGDAEARLSQLCQWVITAERQGHEYGLRLGSGQDCAPGQGRRYRQMCLMRLALYGEFKEAPHA
jgi:uncharacterized protein (DUF58 family)